MPEIFTNPFVIALFAAVLSTLSTVAVRSFARSRGFVATPKTDRWHKRPTAVLGGIAIFVATAAVYLIFIPVTFESLIVMGAGTFLFAVGLVDDLLTIKP